MQGVIETIKMLTLDKASFWRGMIWCISLLAMYICLDFLFFDGDWLRECVSLSGLSNSLACVGTASIHLALQLFLVGGIIIGALALLMRGFGVWVACVKWGSNLANTMFCRGEGEPSFWLYESSMAIYSFRLLEVGTFLVMLCYIIAPDSFEIARIQFMSDAWHSAYYCIAILSCVIVAIWCIKTVFVDIPKYSFYEHTAKRSGQ